MDACRCYRCGCLLSFETLEVDRIKPGCEGGTYARTNIRPACGDCNIETGNAVRLQRATDPSKPACPNCGGQSRYRRKVNGHPCYNGEFHGGSSW
jgi:tRNA(Ile2) C34 agmatinyltransferase TiaS